MSKFKDLIYRIEWHIAAEYGEFIPYSTAYIYLQYLKKYPTYTDFMWE